MWNLAWIIPVIVQLGRQQVSGDAVVKIQMLQYDTYGKDWGGLSCDPGSACDPEFQFCFDHFTSQSSSIDDNNYDCPLGYYDPKHFHQTDFVTFSSTIKGLANPFTIEMDVYPGGFKLKVEVQDDDLFDDDDIDLLNSGSSFIALTRSVDKNNPVKNEYTIRGTRRRLKTYLDIRAWAWCTENYYGLSCDVKCQAQDDTYLGHYTCNIYTGDKECLPGWTSPASNCLASVDDCVGHGCQNGAACVDGHLGYTCLCTKGWKGTLCDNSTCPVCQGGGSCVEGDCVCPPGLTGTDCSTDIDECQLNMCGAGHVCINSHGSYQCIQDVCYNVVCLNGGICEPENWGMCTCPAGFTGVICELALCDIMPCHYGGTCLNGQCACAPGYTGTNCEIDINECDAYPCAEGATCEDLVAGYRCVSGCEQVFCQNGGGCMGNGTCRCEPGFKGERCEVDTCDIIMCLNGGNCDGGLCSCLIGYTGDRCEEDINECLSNPCSGGATCVDLVNGYKCEQHPCQGIECEHDGFCLEGSCVCEPGFTGALCETDMCQLMSCLNGGTCKQGACDCKSGYTGATCETDIDDCATNQCPDGTTCRDLVNGFNCITESCHNVNCKNGGTCENGICRCPVGTTGSLCDVVLCGIIECQNGATCREGQCQCADGYTGSRCAEEVDECASNPCNLGDQCEDEINGYKCIENPCFNVKCENGGTCQNGKCICPPGFLSSDCSVDFCLILDCFNEGSCSSGQCICKSGYYGSQCQNEVNECDSSPCRPGEECVDQIDGFTCLVDACYGVICENNGVCDEGSCICPEGFVGAECRISLCDHVTCQNGGACHSGSCSCLSGYTGTRCEEDIDDCADHPCTSGETCVDKVNSYICLDGCEAVHCQNGGTCNGGVCSCPAGFTGSLCGVDLCGGTRCHNGGWCDAGLCTCVAGFTGSRCAQEIDECASNPCASGETCVDLINSYKCLDGCENNKCSNGATCVLGQCVCQAGFTGRNCKVELCSIIKCPNGGTCHQDRCICAPGYTGIRCEHEINECEPNPCDGGATCVDMIDQYMCIEDHCHNVVCQNQGTCQHSKGGICECKNGYNGTRCENQICSSITCNNGGMCDEDHCTCAPGFTGSRCEVNIDECQSSPCIDVATCVDRVDGYECLVDPCDVTSCQHGGKCINHNNVSICECSPGFLGEICEVDVCDVISCLNGGICEEGDCACAVGYTGKYCEEEVDECASNPCIEGATCVDHVGYYTCLEDPCSGKICFNGANCVNGDCQCLPGFVGFYCKVKICDYKTCFSNGNCEGGQCECMAGYTGTHCQIEVDECQSNPCDIGDTCVDLVDSYECIAHPCKNIECQNGGLCNDDGTCVCPRGYEGVLCDVDLCLYNECFNGGTCHGGVCTCASGYTGSHCQEEVIVVSVCQSNPCSPGEVCVGYETSYKCIKDPRCQGIDCQNGGICHAGKCHCLPKYDGDRCEIDNTCQDYPCEHGGRCEAGVCYCQSGYEGDHCETPTSTRDPLLASVAPVVGNQGADPVKASLTYFGVAIGVLVVILLALLLAVLIRRRRQMQPSPSTSVFGDYLESVQAAPNPYADMEVLAGRRGKPDSNIYSSLASRDTVMKGVIGDDVRVVPEVTGPIATIPPAPPTTPRTPDSEKDKWCKGGLMISARGKGSIFKSEDYGGGIGPSAIIKPSVYPFEK